MRDEELRLLETRWLASGDPEDRSAFLAARVRSGALPEEQLDLLSYLGEDLAELGLEPRIRREKLPAHLGTLCSDLAAWGRRVQVAGLVGVARWLVPRLEEEEGLAPEPNVEGALRAAEVWCLRPEAEETRTAAAEAAEAVEKLAPPRFAEEVATLESPGSPAESRGALAWRCAWSAAESGLVEVGDFAEALDWLGEPHSVLVEAARGHLLDWVARTSLDPSSHDREGLEWIRDESLGGRNPSSDLPSVEDVLLEACGPSESPGALLEDADKAFVVWIAKSLAKIALPEWEAYYDSNWASRAIASVEAWLEDPSLERQREARAFAEGRGSLEKEESVIPAARRTFDHGAQRQTRQSRLHASLRAWAAEDVTRFAARAAAATDQWAPRACEQALEAFGEVLSSSPTSWQASRLDALRGVLESAPARSPRGKASLTPNLMASQGEQRVRVHLLAREGEVVYAPLAEFVDGEGSLPRFRAVSKTADPAEHGETVVGLARYAGPQPSTRAGLVSEDDPDSRRLEALVCKRRHSRGYLVLVRGELSWRIEHYLPRGVVKRSHARHAHGVSGLGKAILKAFGIAPVGGAKAKKRKPRGPS